MLFRLNGAAAFCCLLMLTSAANGDPVALARTVAPDPAARLVAGTIVDLEIVGRVNSKLSRVGDQFAIRLAESIIVDDTVVVPSGTAGVGEVVHAARARAGGKAGELILAARYLQHGESRIGLRSFQFAKSGESRTGTAILFGMAVLPAGFLVAGGEVDVPPGTRAIAKIAAGADSKSEAPHAPRVGQ